MPGHGLTIRQQRPVFPDPAYVYACPECDHTHVYLRTATWATGDGRWRCVGCGWTGEQPEVRPKRKTGAPDRDAVTRAVRREIERVGEALAA